MRRMTSKATNIQDAAKGTESLRLTKTAPNSNYDDLFGGSRVARWVPGSYESVRWPRVRRPPMRVPRGLWGQSDTI